VRPMAIRWDARFVWGFVGCAFSSHSFLQCHIIPLELAFRIDMCSDGPRRRRRWFVEGVRESTLYETDIFDLGHPVVTWWEKRRGRTQALIA